MDDVLFKLVDLNEKGAALSGETAKSDYALAFRIVLGVLAVMVVIGLCAAVTIVRDIARGIGSILRPMRTLATGDLSVDVPHQGEATEIGQIADAVQVFKDAMIAKSAADEVAAQRGRCQNAPGRDRGWRHPQIQIHDWRNDRFPARRPRRKWKRPRAR